MRRLKNTAIATIAAAGLVLGGLAAFPQQAMAAGTSCRTLEVGSDPFSVIRPRMTVPICYNGSKVWLNGSVTGGVNTYGYGISWTGVYNNGGSWMGAGMNYSATLNGGWVTFSCASRWIINSWGNVTSYNRGC